MPYYLYILKSIAIDKFYIGISQNPEMRLSYHNSLERGYTSRYRPWKIIYTKKYDSKKEAASAEKKIKSWKSKKMIERLLNGEVRL